MSDHRNPWLVRIFLLSHLLIRFLNWLNRTVQAIWQGIWLGLLSRVNLNHTVVDFYNRKSMYVSSDHNDQGLFPWERSAIENYFGDCRSLLVTSAGGGREMLALNRLGFEVTGCEGNREYLESAKALLEREGLPPRVFFAGYNEPLELDEQFDGLVIGWGAYNHIQGRANRIEFLDRVGRLLRPGGPLLLSFIIRTSLQRRSMRLSARIANTLRCLVRQPGVEEGDAFLETGYFHYFTREEIESEAAAAGFAVLMWDDYGYGHCVMRDNDRQIGSPT